MTNFTEATEQLKKAIETFQKEIDKIAILKINQYQKMTDKEIILYLVSLCKSFEVPLKEDFRNEIKESVKNL